MLGKNIPLLVLVACVMAQSELRANVYPSQPVRLKQPDGTPVTVKFYGDEFLWWAETTDGYTVAKVPRDGWWYYATTDAQGRLVPTEFRVGKTVPRDLPLQPHLTPGVEVISAAQAERAAFNAAIEAARTTGNLTLGVILIEFPDESGGSYGNEAYWNLFFSEGVYNGQSPSGEDVFGSVRDYFLEVSYGQLSITGDILNNTGPDGRYQWLVADHEKNWYESDSVDKDALIVEAVDKARQASRTQPGFGNPDSYDIICVSYAGELGINGLWQHVATTPGYESAYINGEEWGGTFIHIGGHCHEIGHQLGLTDKYTTTRQVGYYGLMGKGNWNGPKEKGACPAHITAVGKISLGWVTPNVVSVDGPLSLGPVESDPASVYKMVSDNGEGETYYIVENRVVQPKPGYGGVFDQYLPGREDGIRQGILIWAIDDYSSPEETFVPADDDWKVEVWDGGDYFPGTTNNTDFDGTTHPSSNFGESDDVASGLALNNISLGDGFSVEAQAHVNKWTGKIVTSLTWNGIIDLIGNVDVHQDSTVDTLEVNASTLGDSQQSVVLTISSGSTVNLNGYRLKSTGTLGGRINREPNVAFNPDIQLLSAGTELTGQYPTIEWATSEASAADEVLVRGTVVIDSNVAVSSGTRLTVEPASTLQFLPGTELQINGTLNAVGSGSSHITFTRSGTSGSWGGIHFEDSSDDEACKLEYCTIEYGTDGVVCNHASPTIHNCKIRHNNTGIRLIASGADVQHCQINSNSTGVYAYSPASSLELKNNRIFYNSSYGMYLTYTDNWIHDNDLYNNISGSSGAGIYCYHSNAQLEQDTVKYSGSDGIRLYYSSPDLWRNPVHDNGANGVNCTYYSHPYFQEDVDLTGNNIVAYNGADGVRVDGTSHPVLSLNDDDHPANNSIYSNDGREVYSLQSEEIEASWNWWGQYPPSSSEFYGNVHYMPALFSNPNSEPARGVPKAAGSEPLAENQGEIGVSDDSASIHYHTGYKHELAGEWSEAIDEYQLVIDRWPETREAEMALARLPRCYDNAEMTKESEDAYIASVAQDKADYEVGGRADQMQAADWLDQGLYDDAFAKYEELRRRFPDSRIAQEALFDEWQITFNIKDDREGAKALMAEYEKSYGSDDLLTLMQICMGEAVTEKDPKLARSAGATSGLPSRLALLPGYPNPFNPSVTLRYELPEAAHVRIQVFDVLGHPVAVLVDRRLPAGRYSVAWNGQRDDGTTAASGVYLVRLETGSRCLTRKVTLLK